MLVRVLIVGLIALLWIAELLFLGERFAHGDRLDRTVLGAILVGAIPVTWQMARIGRDYLRTGR